MSAQENRTLVENMYQSQARGDFAGFLSAAADDISITVPGHGEMLPWKVSCRGKENIGPWLADMSKHIKIDRVELKEFIADRDKVVILLHEWLTVVENQFSFELDEVHVHTVKDGKVVDITMYEDTATVVAAVRGKEVTQL